MKLKVEYYIPLRNTLCLFIAEQGDLLHGLSVSGFSVALQCSGGLSATSPRAIRCRQCTFRCFTPPPQGSEH